MALAWALASLCQVALALLLVAAVLHLGRSALHAGALGPEERPPAPPIPVEPPRVTVQLPLRNERAVAARVMRAAAALDWPRDRLQLQVLDDSDDETVGLVDDATDELRAAGHDVEVVRRIGRAGFKAGALQHAMARATGELLLVLDADSLPEPDLVRRLAAPLLAEPGLAFTQGRWSFDNREASLLTRVQALILDGLMLVEQPLLSRRRLPVQFNGTAGMWRRSSLEAAGGWLGGGAGASVTEDLDLSYRARLAGHLGRSIDGVVVRTELPSTMAAFRAQQERWVRGGGEVLRGLARRLAAGTIPAKERLTMAAHLARHARQPLLVAAAIWLPAITALDLALPLSGGPWAAIVAAVLSAVAMYYGWSQRRAGRSPAEAIALAPVVVALSMGMSLVLTRAFLRGLLAWGAGEFVRTPKAGGYGARIDPLAWIEVGVGGLTLYAAALAIARGDLLAGLALSLLVGAGELWVGVASLRG